MQLEAKLTPTRNLLIILHDDYELVFSVIFKPITGKSYSFIKCEPIFRRSLTISIKQYHFFIPGLTKKGMFNLNIFNSIRTRMVSGFLFLTFLVFVLAIVSLSIIDRVTKIASLHSNISQLEILTLNLIKSDNDFFEQETLNDDYFKTHKSSFIDKHDSLNYLIRRKIKAILRDETEKDFGVRNSLQVIDSMLLLYHVRFINLEKLVYKKGFKDYGIEGLMRYHAHALENVIEPPDFVGVLFLRRHEKDYLLRNDTSYLESFQERAFALRKKMELSSAKQPQAIYHLDNYRRLFNQLASIQGELGLSSKHGLRNELNKLTHLLSEQYYSLSEYSLANTQAAYYSLRIFYICLLSGAILFSILSGYWISKRLSEPIAQLSQLIKQSLQSGNIAKTDFRIRNAAVEITTLATSFILLMDQVKIQLANIKDKSNLLKKKNKELKKLNEELDNFLYSTAHDLRSPLSSLLGLVNLVRIENTQPVIVEYIALMEKSILRSESFISQIVSYSKNKRTEIKVEYIDLNTLISDILADHQFFEGALRIQKVVKVVEIVPFYSDRGRLLILFNNLISNAIKYADVDKDLQFFKIFVNVNQHEAEIEFTDNGIGIDESHLKNIFDMFYRAHQHSKGSGLGLYIFKETVHRLGGHASVESTVGFGTKFYIRIPNLVDTVRAQENLDFDAQR